MVVRTGPTPERLILAARVKALRETGLLGQQVADRLGISRTYVYELESDPEGAKGRARKDSYAGVCEVCGKPTSGSHGRRRAPTLCDECSHEKQAAEKRWTAEAVIDAIQRFAAAHGRPPTANEWIRADPVRGYPVRTSVYVTQTRSHSPFPTWADAIVAAGFPRPVIGHYPRPPKVTRGRQVTTTEGRKTMKDYVVLHSTDGGKTWRAVPSAQAYSETMAIEQTAETEGTAEGVWVAVLVSRWVERKLEAVTTFKAVAATAAK